MRDDSKQNLAHSVYEQLRSELFDFRLLPGDHFSEIEVAERTGASRTPVRQALYRLHSEGFLEVRPMLSTNCASCWNRPLSSVSEP
jgi:DNA-binding GntR family transcriptional regulator